MVLFSSTWLNSLGRFGLNILKLNLSLGFIAASLLYVFQGKLIYPTTMPPGSREKVPKPSEFGLKDWEEIELKSPDQVKFKAFLIFTDSEKGKTNRYNHDEKPNKKNVRPTILMLHANAGNVGHRLPIAKVFVERFGFNVLAISYRGYGHSEGSPNETGILLDSQTSLDFLKSHKVLGSSRIFLYGQSLGGAVAIGLSSDKANYGKIDGVILENTFSNLRKLIPVVMPVLKYFRFLCHQTWKSDERIKNLKRADSPPFLFLSGSKDDLIPVNHFRELYELCNSEIKTWKSFENGNHNDTCLQEGYFQTIAHWVEDIANSSKSKLANN